MVPVSFVAELSAKPRASCILGKPSTTEPEHSLHMPPVSPRHPVTRRSISELSRLNSLHLPTPDLGKLSPLQGSTPGLRLEQKFYPPYFFSIYSFSENVCTYVRKCTSHSLHSEVRGQLLGVGTPLSPCEFWGLKSGCQACWQVPLPSPAPS